MQRIQAYVLRATVATSKWTAQRQSLCVRGMSTPSQQTWEDPTGSHSLKNPMAFTKQSTADPVAWETQRP